MLLHTDMRRKLQRFFARRKEIPIFLKDEVKSNTTELENQKVDAQFLADLTSHLIELNLKLQGNSRILPTYLDT